MKMERSADNVHFLISVILLIFTVLFFGCSKKDVSSAAKEGGPVKLTIIKVPGRHWVPEEPNIQEIMKRTNTILDVQMPPSIAEMPQYLNVHFAANDLADIIQIDRTDFLQYINTGHLRVLDDLLQYAPNLMKVTTPKAWALMTVGGKKYAYPYENNTIKNFISVRGDWLKNLGIDLKGHEAYGDTGYKVTLAEYADIVRQFTKNDPDKNGKNDTYGLGTAEKLTINNWTNIYAAFGGSADQYYLTDNKVYPWVISVQYRQALTYINGLWKEGLVDPEIFILNADQAKQKTINGVIGSCVGNWWSRPFESARDGGKKLNPDMDWIPLLLTSSDGKTFGVRDNGLITNTTSINTDCKVPEKAMQFLDFLQTQEGWELARLGIKDVDYYIDNDGYPMRTEEGTKRFNSMNMDILFDFGNRKDLENHQDSAPQTDPLMILRRNWVMLQFIDIPVYTSVFYGYPPPEAYNSFGQDVNAYLERMNMAFITGETALTDANWNTYINDWKKMGGVKIMQGYIDGYNKLNGTNMTSGIPE
jgi:putative aldouronate transport system substrate-binding protein